ncbi:hypothetical protein L6R49_28975 [Myxococcota bacterium]|nr:hypothetical protein [Myxococcota bacterium]
MSGRLHLPRALALSLLLVAGCPTPPEEGGEGAGGQPPPAGGPAPDGQQQPPGGGPAPGGEGAPGAVAPGGPSDTSNAKFATLIAEGSPTVTITVNVVGSWGKSQLDFFALRTSEDGKQTSPVALHIERWDGTSPVKIVAPATLADEIYVSAAQLDDKDMPKMDDNAGASVAAPIKLAGQDVELSLTLGQHADWFNKMRQDLPPPDPTKAPVPPGGPATPPTPGADGMPPAPPAGTPPAAPQ